MKKISILMILTLVMLSTMPVFAVDNVAMEFTGEEINLSLTDAENMMLKSGTAIETANINVKINKAKTSSYYENVSDIESLDRLKGSGLAISTPSKTQKEMASYAANFAKEQTQRNYDAELNQIIRDTVENYYKLAQAKESQRISADNVVVQEKLYQNTQSKFNLGVVSKQDVLKAEIGLNEAKVNAEKAENMYSNARMGFNIQFGYELMQNIIITDNLEEVAISDVALDDAIAKALTNRNEIKGAAFGEKMAEYTLRENGNKISKSSAKYHESAANLAGAQASNKNAPKMIEMDVRSKYMNMIQKKSEVELGKLSVSNAKETYRLANLQYDAGMATLTDTQQAQLGAYQAELSYYSTLLDYNLAVIDYEQSTTVGTYSVKF